MPLGDFLVAYLQKIGVTHLFGIPGDLVLRLFSRLGKPRGLKIVTLSHEPGVGFAADGYARATGRIGVVCVTYGAGGHNMVNPVAGSFSERVPVLVISGGPGEEERKLGTLIHHQAKEIESQLRIYRELTCAARVIDDAATAAESVHEVVRTVWREQRPGYLEIHRDMVERPIPVPRGIIAWDGALVFGRSDERRVDEAVRETAERFNAARRPLTMVGIETFRYKLQKDIRALAERMGAPVTTTVLGKGAFPMDHPLFMGVHIGPLSPPPIVKRVDRADLVLNLGTLLTDMNLGSRPPQITRDRSIWAVGGRVNVSFHTYTDVHIRDFVRGLLRARLSRHEEKVRYCDNLPPQPAETKRRLRVTDVLHEVNRFLRGRPPRLLRRDRGDRAPRRPLAGVAQVHRGLGAPGPGGVVITVGRRYTDLVAAFRWAIPEEFNFGALVDAWATDRSRAALYWEDEAGRRERHTFWDVKQASNRCMNALAGLGVGRGDPVMVMLPRVPAWQAAIVGGLKLGALVVPCTASLRAKDVAYRARHSGAKAIVTTLEPVPDVQKALAEVPGR